MAKKIMLWPSARTKFVKDGNMKIIFYSLIVLSAVMIFLNWYMYAFMYAVKLLLMILVSLWITNETEILFYSHDKDINRVEAKELIKKSYPNITALMYALLIPIGTPLWLVAIGAILATLLGKLLFGGFHHMVFHSSIVGVIFVTLGWPGLVDSVGFMTSFDNYLIDLVFNNDFFNNTLAIGGMFDPDSLTSALGMLTSGDMYNLTDVFLGTVPGIIGSGALILLIFLFLVLRKAVNWITPVTMMASFILFAFIYSTGEANSLEYVLYHLLTGSFLFVTVFIVTDPITTPIDTRGKLIFGFIAGALTIIIREAGRYEEGVYFATLFMMMLTPMLNQSFKKKKVVKKPVPKKAGA